MDNEKLINSVDLKYVLNNTANELSEDENTVNLICNTFLETIVNILDNVNEIIIDSDTIDKIYRIPKIEERTIDKSKINYGDMETEDRSFKIYIKSK